MNNIRVLVCDKTREDEVLLITSVQFDLSSANNAVLVSLDNLHIDLHLESINALIHVLRGIGTTSLRNVSNYNMFTLSDNCILGTRQ